MTVFLSLCSFFLSVHILKLNLPWFLRLHRKDFILTAWRNRAMKGQPWRLKKATPLNIHSPQFILPNAREQWIWPFEKQFLLLID